MIHNAASYVIKVLEAYVTEARELSSVPLDVVRDELVGVRERVGELIAEIDRSDKAAAGK